MGVGAGRWTANKESRVVCRWVDVEGGASVVWSGGATSDEGGGESRDEGGRDGLVRVTAVVSVINDVWDPGQEERPIRS